MVIYIKFLSNNPVACPGWRQACSSSLPLGLIGWSLYGVPPQGPKELWHIPSTRIPTSVAIYHMLLLESQVYQPYY